MPRTSSLVPSVTPTDSPVQNRPSFQKRIVMAFFSVFALLSGSIFMTIGVKQLHLATASRAWPKAEARVTASAAEYYSSGKSKGYSQRFAYDYQVDNVSYKGTRIDFNERLTKTPEESWARVDHHKQADRIWIHYDPAQPGQSVYRPGPQGGTYLLVALAVLPLLFGATLLVLVLRQLRTPRNVAPFP